MKSKKMFHHHMFGFGFEKKNGIIDTIEQFKWILIQSIKHVTMLNAILICLYGVF